MNAVYSIRTEAQTKAYVHPLRMKIVSFLAKEPRTISQVAQELDTHPANITHHFRLLEDAELIRLVEERDIGRVVEKYYASVARAFSVESGDAEPKDARGRVLGFLRDDLSAALAANAAEEGDGLPLIGLIKQARIAPQDATRFFAGIEKLIREFESARDAGGDAYTMNLSLYPYQTDYGTLRKLVVRGKRKKKS